MEKGESQRIVTEIMDRNYALVSFSLPWSKLKEVADLFISFCALPADVKARFAAAHPEEPTGYIGYQRRDRSKGHYETKEMFHFHPAIFNVIPGLKTNPKISNFVDAAANVYEKALATFKQLLTSLSAEEPGLIGRFIREDGHSQCYLRILNYDEIPVGSNVASPHYDRGGLALALAESAPGLRIWSKGVPFEVDHKGGHAIFMPGITFSEVTKKLKLPKTWHDAIQKVPSYKPGTSRWAIVFFADPLEQRHVTAEEARTYTG